MLRRARQDGERGAIAIIFVIVLIVLLGVGGLVVDLGFASQKARQIQNSADAAALAAAQSLPSTTNAVSTAQSYASTNLPDGSFPWSTCTDSSRPAGWSAGPECRPRAGSWRTS